MVPQNLLRLTCGWICDSTLYSFSNSLAPVRVVTPKLNTSLSAYVLLGLGRPGSVHFAAKTMPFCPLATTTSTTKSLTLAHDSICNSSTALGSVTADKWAVDAASPPAPPDPPPIDDGPPPLGTLASSGPESGPLMGVRSTGTTTSVSSSKMSSMRSIVHPAGSCSSATSTLKRSLRSFTRLAIVSSSAITTRFFLLGSSRR
mmetsp:Transcript_5106/g.18384  ORF Transcript_5106/g.18384 Transcript_5106/m.18384 type:complete len:202 (+) Transcript_5106:2889-3494(+)